MFEPHFGIDESGKGDFFGPLVIAGAYTDAASTRALMDAGVMDSKRITSAAKIAKLADIIRATPGVAHEVINDVSSSYLARVYSIDCFGDDDKYVKRGDEWVEYSLVKG